MRALAQLVACEIHPLNNLRVLKYLVRELKVDDEAKNAWYRHWVRVGLEAFERQLAQLPPSTYCYGDTPTMADCCLVPQIFNGQRFDCDFSGLPRTMAAFDACMAHRLPEGAAFALPRHRERDDTAADWLMPDWPAPPDVRAVCTTRAGGVSLGAL